MEKPQVWWELTRNLKWKKRRWIQDKWNMSSYRDRDTKTGWRRMRDGKRKFENDESMAACNVKSYLYSFSSYLLVFKLHLSACIYMGMSSFFLIRSSFDWRLVDKSFIFTLFNLRLDWMWFYPHHLIKKARRKHLFFPIPSWFQTVLIRTCFFVPWDPPKWTQNVDNDLVSKFSNCRGNCLIKWNDFPK